MTPGERIIFSYRLIRFAELEVEQSNVDVKLSELAIDEAKCRLDGYQIQRMRNEIRLEECMANHRSLLTTLRSKPK